MKRDMDLIRLILLEAQNGNLNSDIKGFESDVVKYHKKLAIEAGLLEGKVQNNLENTSVVPSAVHVKDLTWHGHDFLDSIESDNNWSKVKGYIKESGKIVTIETVKQAVKIVFQSLT
ncbi:DUF2513 domain-containing protein [Shewanella putrefaciens]|uniref:DUF2513 domain-containing protein n=1 Tax=Shewanella putrefaciens TaxID=24 RepID=UPI0018E7EC2A|nr:DUF2513 domain-containing protein [Shewanella putrefaciens]